MFTQPGHFSGDLQGAVTSFQCEGILSVKVEAEPRIQSFKTVDQRCTCSFSLGGHFAYQHGRCNAVLVAGMCSDEVSVAFLVAHDKFSLTRFLKLGDLFADILESRQGALHFHAAAHGSLRSQFAGDNCGDQRGFRRYFAMRNHKISQQRACLVARKQLVIAVVLHCAADSVAVRVGADHNVGAVLPGQFNAELQCCAVFRVGGLYGGEIAVGLFLFFNHGNVGVTGFLQGPQHRLQTRPVQRRVHDGYVLVDFRIAHHRLLLHFFHKGGVHLVRDPGNAAGFQPLFKSDPLAVREQVQLFNFAQHFVGRRGGHLAAVGPVHFVPIIFGGIVGGGHHDARRAMQGPGSIGNAGHRHQFFKNVGLDPVGRKHLRCNLREYIALDAAVVADGDAALFRREMVDHIIAQTLGRPGHDIHVHAVGAGSDDTPEARRAKLQILIERVLNFCFVAGHSLQFRFQIRIRHRLLHPDFILFL